MERGGGGKEWSSPQLQPNGKPTIFLKGPKVRGRKISPENLLMGINICLWPGEGMRKRPSGRRLGEWKGREPCPGCSGENWLKYGSVTSVPCVTYHSSAQSQSLPNWRRGELTDLFLPCRARQSEPANKPRSHIPPMYQCSENNVAKPAASTIVHKYLSNGHQRNTQ